MLAVVKQLDIHMKNKPRQRPFTKINLKSVTNLYVKKWKVEHFQKKTVTLVGEEQSVCP